MNLPRLLTGLCLLFLLSNVCEAQFFTLPGSFSYSLNSINQVFDISPDGKIAAALRNDPSTVHPAYLTTFDPLTGTQFDSKSFGFGPLGVQLAKVGDSLRAVVLTSQGGPRSIYLFDVGADGKLTQLATTQLTTSIFDEGSTLALSGKAHAGFTIVAAGSGHELVIFSLDDGAILNRLPVSGGGTLAMAETSDRRVVAFLSDSVTLALVDATDPAHPNQFGTVALPRNTEFSGISTAGIAFSGDARYVFVANNFVDLSAVDVTAQQVVGTVGGNFRFGRVRVSENDQRRLLAVLSSTSGTGAGQPAVLLVDATNPSHLSVVNQFSGPFSYKSDIAFSHTGGRLYVIAIDRLLALDTPSMTRAWEQLLIFSATREHQVMTYGQTDEVLGAWEAFVGNNLDSVFGSFPASPPNVSVNDVTVTEGDSGTTGATFTVSLSAPTTHKVTVGFSTASGTATQGSDFTGVTGTLTFAPGETSKTVTVPVVGDTTDEFDETFTLNLSNPTVGIITRGQGTGTILDDDPPPSVSVADASIVEGDSGSKTVNFNVTLSAASGKPVTMNYSTADGTAKAGSDYVAASGSLTFNPGEVSKTVGVLVSGDTLTEGNETFFLNLDSPSNATIARAQAVCTIIDDDPKVQFDSGTYSVKEGVDRSLTVTVTRTGDISVTTSVQYETVNNTASDRSDYTAAAGTLRFAPNESSKTITILITDDAFAESAESFTVRLFNPTGGGLGTPATATVTINDNDSTTGPSPVSASSFDADFFVRQHYHDFLNREPDISGLRYWTNEITSCGSDAACADVKRINVSAAFFLSIEFQETGYFVYRLHQAAFGTGEHLPLKTFLSDTQEIGMGVVVGSDGWQQKLEANKQAFADEFVQRPQFVAQYPQPMTAAQFVDALAANTGDPQNRAAGAALSQAERDQLVSDLSSGAKTRAQVLRAVAENAEFNRRQFNKAFVLMQYFGYLRRNPNDAPDTDFSGYQFWLAKLDQFDGNFVQAEMVKAFISSLEYQQRFGK
jgi:hypothetical protein